MTDETWKPISRQPAAFRTITCRTEDGKEYYGLCYCSHRNEIIEPISAIEAEMKIGKITEWRYED